MMSSRRTFSNVHLSRKFHPPLRRSPRYTVEAEYDYDTNLITIFLPGLKKNGYNVDKKFVHKEIIRILVHETLHGVIHKLCDQDKIDVYTFNDHLPIGQLE